MFYVIRTVQTKSLMGSEQGYELIVFRSAWPYFIINGVSTIKAVSLIKMVK